MLVVLAGLVEAFTTLQGSGADPAGAWLASLPGFYCGILPVLAAISMGMFSFCRRTPLHALVMAVVVTIFMVGLDIVTGSNAAGSEAVGFEAGGVISASRASDFTGVSMIGALTSWLTGELVLSSVRAATYHSGDPWVVVGFAVTKLGFLSLPILLAGVVVGVQAWTADHVTFRRSVDATAARITIAWFLAPFVFVLVRSWTLRILFQVLFANSKPSLLFLPFVVIAVPAAIGWVTARRVARWLS